MSWSVSASGKPREVMEWTKTTLAGYRCAGAEEGIKGAAGQLIALALGAMPAEAQVSVTAFGSATTPDPNRPGEQLNSLSLTIKV